MKIRTGILLSTVMVIAIGCSSDGVADKDMKRTQDRLAMQLSDSQNERSTLKTQLDRTTAELAEAKKGSADSSQAIAQLKKQVQDLEQTNTTLTSQIEKLRTDLANATVARTAPLNK